MAEPKPEGWRCCCPFCDEELTEDPSPICKACGVTVLYCPECHQPVARDEKICPHCGAKIKE